MKSYRNLILILIYIGPCLFGNYIGNIPPPYSPVNSILISLIFCGYINYKKSISNSNLLFFLSYILLVTFIGLLFLENTFLRNWTQSPNVRALNSILSDIIPLFSFLYIFKYFDKLSLVNKNSISTSIVKSGSIYCLLAILQLLIFLLFSYDIFPIVRAENIQSVIDQEGFYRVNGLSGEPRYLASYCSFWVFFLMTSWRNILLRNNIKIVILAIYLMVSIFCFSKTGLFTLITGTFILIYNYYAIGNKEYNVLDIKSIILLITTLILSSIILFKIRFTGYDDELYLNTVSLFGIAVEVEPQDLSAIQVWTSSYLHLIFGVGSGLFQYYFDPFSIDAVFRYFKIVDTLDSWRSNISLLNKLVGYGLIGTCLFYYLIFKTFRKYIINNFYTLSLLFIFLFIGLLKISEFYAFIFLPVLLYNLFGNINKAQ